MTAFEEFASYLDYHPRRGLLYLGIGAAALCVWIFASADARYKIVPLVFAGGSFASQAPAKRYRQFRFYWPRCCRTLG